MESYLTVNCDVIQKEIESFKKSKYEFENFNLNFITKKTNLERYGVEYPMQVLEFAEKQQKNSKKVIKYNDNLYYQGSYEKDFLDYISSLGMIEELKRGPSIKYKLNDTNRIYYPDFYLENYNLIIEVKSSYYYDKFLEKNIEKKKKCIEDGFNFLFIINKNYKPFELAIEHLKLNSH